MAAGLLAFFIALFASVMVVGPVRALALSVGLVDLPGPRKVHLKPIPLLGGLAMYGAVVIAVLSAFHGPARAQVVGILIGATLVAGVGILDDRGVLHHQVKLFIGMPLAAAILMVSGIRAQVFSVLLGGRGGEYLDVALTVVWVVGITASFSILDLEATSRTIWAPMFSNLSSSSISLATVTPSLVMRGAPNDLSSTTLRPLGPSVTLTALLRMSTPRSMRSRASTPNLTSLADIFCFLEIYVRGKGA